MSPMTAHADHVEGTLPPAALMLLDDNDAMFRGAAASILGAIPEADPFARMLAEQLILAAERLRRAARLDDPSQIPSPHWCRFQALAERNFRSALAALERRRIAVPPVPMAVPSPDPEAMPDPEAIPTSDPVSSVPRSTEESGDRSGAAPLEPASAPKKPKVNTPGAPGKRPKTPGHARRMERASERLARIIGVEDVPPIAPKPDVERRRPGAPPNDGDMIPISIVLPPAACPS